MNNARASSQLLRNSLSTYGRLLGTFAVGLYLTPFLGRSDHMGLAGLGLFALLMSSVGLINILQATVRGSLVRELSRAFHSEDPHEMQRGFTAALVACLAVAVALSGLMLIGTPVALAVFQFGPRFADQMLWSWMTLSLYTGWVVMTVPFITLFDATHRIPHRNLNMFLERCGSLVAAIVVFSLPIGRQYPLFAYVLADCLVLAMVRLGCAIWAYTTCPHVGIDLKAIDKTRVREVIQTGTHVGRSEIANNLYDRTNQLLINVTLGAVLNGIFGIVVLLIGYTKQIAMGISFGLEPLAAKLSHHGDQSKVFIGPFLLTITRIQAGIIFPIIATLFVMGRPLVDLWLGEEFNIQRFAANRDIAHMLMILLVGSPFFVIMQGPLRIMLGAGDVRAYATRLLEAGIAQASLAALILIFIPGLVRDYFVAQIVSDNFLRHGINPVSAITAHRSLNLLAENTAMYAVATSMSIIYLIVYGLYVPMLSCRLYELRQRAMYIGSMWPGALVGLIVGLLLALYRRNVDDANGWLVVAGIFGAALISAPLFWFTVLARTERDRLKQMILRRARADHP